MSATEIMFYMQCLTIYSRDGVWQLGERSVCHRVGEVQVRIPVRRQMAAYSLMEEREFIGCHADRASPPPFCLSERKPDF